MKKRVTRMFALLGVLAFQQPLPAQEASSQLVAIDLRPQEEKDGLGLIALSGKCNKDVFRIADVASDPVKVEVLRAGLAEQLGLASDGKTLTVLNWSVYYNKQKPGGSFLESVGVQGYDLPTGKKKEKGGAGSKCSQKESAGGWYEGSEVTTIVRSFRNSLEPTVANPSTCAWFTPFAARSMGSSRVRRTTPRNCSPP